LKFEIPSELGDVARPDRSPCYNSYLLEEAIIMLRTRVVILTISTALACGVAALACSGLAIAHEFLVNGSAIKAGEKVEVKGSGGVALEAEIAKTPAHIGCGEGLLPAGASNLLEEAGKFKSKIELKACGIDMVIFGVEEDLPKCKVANFNVENTGALTEAGIATVLGTGAEKLLGQILVSEVTGAGACTLAGTYKLLGTTTCDIPDYPVTSPGIVVGCNPLGGKEVKLDGGESVKLDLVLGIEGAKGQTFSSN
jgi:hypothetical protein